VHRGAAAAADQIDDQLASEAGDALGERVQHAAGLRVEQAPEGAPADSAVLRALEDLRRVGSALGRGTHRHREY
jgi:hypothetical protein